MTTTNKPILKTGHAKNFTKANSIKDNIIYDKNLTKKKVGNIKTILIIIL